MEKTQNYKKIIEILDPLLNSPQTLSFQAKLSITCSVIHKRFPHWIFCGFYVVTNHNPNLLEIGPFHGDTLPCTNIKFGKGVCGTSAIEGQTIIVDSVKDYSNYISCDSDTASEIVVPVFQHKKLAAVLDIDSPFIADFDTINQGYLEKIIKLIK